MSASLVLGQQRSTEKTFIPDLYCSHQPPSIPSSSSMMAIGAHSSSVSVSPPNNLHGREHSSVNSQNKASNGTQFPDSSTSSPPASSTPVSQMVHSKTTTTGSCLSSFLAGEKQKVTGITTFKTKRLEEKPLDPQLRPPNKPAPPPPMTGIFPTLNTKE